MTQVFHSETTRLVRLWGELADLGRPQGALPSRRRLRPEALGPALTRALMMERFGDDARVRLAGDAVEAFHDEALRGAAWSTLWLPESRVAATTALRRAVREGRPVVLAALSPGTDPAVEIALAPFRDEAAGREVILGLYAGLVRSQDRRPRRLSFAGCVAVGEARRPPLALAALDGRRIA